MKKLVLAAALALPMVANAAPYYGTGFRVNGNGVAVSYHKDVVIAFVKEGVWFHLTSLDTEDKCENKETIKFTYKNKSNLVSVVGDWDDVSRLCYINPKTSKGREFIENSIASDVGKRAGVVFVSDTGVSLRGLDAAIKELKQLGEPL